MGIRQAGVGGILQMRLYLIWGLKGVQEFSRQRWRKWHPGKIKHYVQGHRSMKRARVCLAGEIELEKWWATAEELCRVLTLSGFPDGTTEAGVLYSCFTSSQLRTVWEKARVCPCWCPYLTWERNRITVHGFVIPSPPQPFSHPPVHFFSSSVLFSDSSNSLSLLLSSFHRINSLVCLCLKNACSWLSTWLQVTFIHAGSRLGVFSRCLNHPPHISVLHFCHMLLLPNSLSVLLSLLKPLASSFVFFHFLVFKGQHSTWHLVGA